MKRFSIQALVALLIVVVSAALSMAGEPAKTRVSVDISNHPFKGPVNAPVVMVVFSDYL